WRSARRRGVSRRAGLRYKPVRTADLGARASHMCALHLKVEACKRWYADCKVARVMAPRRSPRARSHQASASAAVVDPSNAAQGQDRAGAALARGQTIAGLVVRPPIDPSVADQRVADEGPEIRARVRARGHDVVAPDDDDGE